MVVRLGLVPRWMFWLVLVETFPSMSHYFPGMKSTSRTGVCFVFMSVAALFRSRFGGIFRQTDLPFNSLPDVCAQGLRLTDSCEARGRLAVPVVVGLVDKSVLVTP